MTEELYNKVISKIQEELKDVKEYSAMCDSSTGYIHAVIRCIIKDEKSHAKYLINALRLDGKTIPENITTEYNSLITTFC